MFKAGTRVRHHSHSNKMPKVDMPFVGYILNANHIAASEVNQRASIMTYSFEQTFRGWRAAANRVRILNQTIYRSRFNIESNYLFQCNIKSNYLHWVWKCHQKHNGHRQASGFLQEQFLYLQERNCSDSKDQKSSKVKKKKTAHPRVLENVSCYFFFLL